MENNLPLGDQIENSIIRAFGGTPKTAPIEPLAETKESPSQASVERVSTPPDTAIGIAEESVLRVLANFALLSGVLLALVMILLPQPIIEPSPLDIYQMQPRSQGSSGVFMAIYIFIGSLVTWAFLRVIANISDSLKSIASKIIPAP